jgi:hypothetical protein
MPYCNRGKFYLKYYANSVKYGMSGDFALDEAAVLATDPVPRLSPVTVARLKGQLPAPPCPDGRMSYRFPETKDIERHYESVRSMFVFTTRGILYDQAVSQKYAY